MALVRVYCGVAAAEMAPWLTVAVVDDSGRLLDMRHISDDPAGYAYLGALLADRSGGAAPVAMDRHDHLVAQLLAAANRPLAIADEAGLADFAERFSDDTSYEEMQAPLSQRHAVGLARALQAGALYATAQSPSWNLDEFKPVLAAHAAVTAGRQAAAAALREVLRELYPAALRAYPDPAEYVPLKILEAMPEPGLLSASPSSRNREAALVSELSASGVADTTTAVSAITALRVAVEESPRWNANRALAPVVAETVRQSVAAVRACDAASAALIATLVERLGALTAAPAPTRPYLVHSASTPQAAPVSPAVARRGPAAEVPPSRLSPRVSAASAAAAGVPAAGPVAVGANHSGINHSAANHNAPTHSAATRSAASHSHSAGSHTGANHSVASHSGSNHTGPNHTVPSHAGSGHTGSNHAVPGRAGSHDSGANHAVPGHTGANPSVPSIPTQRPGPDYSEPAAYGQTGRSFPPPNSFPEPDYQEPAYADQGYAEPSYSDPAYPGGGAYQEQPYPQQPYQEQGYQEQGYQEQGYPPDGYQDPAAYAEPAHHGDYRPDYAQPAYQGTGYAEAGYAENNYAEPGYAETGYAAQGYTEPGYTEPGYTAAPTEAGSGSWAAVGGQDDFAAVYAGLPASAARAAEEASANTLAFSMDPLTGPLRGAPGPAGATTDTWPGGQHSTESPALRLVDSPRDPLTDPMADESAPPALRVIDGGRRADTAAPATEDNDLLIFSETQSNSAWFILADANAPAEDTPSWGRLADEGWRAAEQLARPAVGAETMAGLPRRVPQANLVPGSAEEPPRQLRIVRDPQSIAAHTSGYFRGWQRGQEIGGYAVGQRDRAAWEFNREQRARESEDQRARLS